MFFVRRAHHIPKVIPRVSLAGSKTNYTTNAAHEEQIVIPKRIPRSPTDILRALSSTVGNDPTAAHYKYHDDPYLIPTSNVGKRTYAMAQESGRRAAKWIKEQHRDLFMHNEAQPPIKEFAPKLVFTDESEVDESALQDLIRHSEVKDAVFVYNLMKEKNIEICNELKQNLLELICFYNNEEPLPEEFIEERWFNQNNNAARERPRKTWKDNELAEQLFGEMEPKTAASYATIIRGMAKFYQAERAYALLQEAREKQLEVDTRTYNAIISISSFLKETSDLRWALCCELLEEMAQQQLKPDIGTLNSLLETITTFGNVKFARSCALKVLSEFKKLGIEPSLATYYYVLSIFCRDRGPVSHVIVDVLREIEGKEFSIVDPKDVNFFIKAMNVCRNHLHDKALAKKVHALLHTGNNYNLIGDSSKESTYYRHYFALLCQTEPLEEFMQTYDLLVPNIYIPEPGIMEEILKTVEMNGAVELLPRLWSDLVVFDYTNREGLLTRTLKIIIDSPPSITKPTQEQLPAQLVKVALDIYNKVQDPQDPRKKKLSFTGQMIGDILTVLVRGSNYQKAVEVFTYIDRNQHLILGTPSESCMNEFIGACIANKAPTQAITCLQYCSDNNMECLTLAKRINNGFTLNEVHLSKLKSLVGDAFLKNE